MRARPVRRGCGWLVAAVLASGLGACGGGAGQQAAPSATTLTASPLGSAFTLFGLGQSEQARINQEAEELIARCMKDQGFEYDQPHVPDRPALDPEDDPRDEAQQRGYGIVDSAKARTTAGPQRSPAEQAAYDRALYGDRADHAEDETVAVYDWRREGCLGAAYHEATGGADDLLRDERFAALFDAVREAEAEALASEAAAALAQEWSDCMAALGHPELGVPQEARSTVERELAELAALDGDPAEARQLAELRRREVDLAVADVTCQEDVGYSARLDQLLWAAHAGLVERFATDLVALAEAHP